MAIVTKYSAYKYSDYFKTELPELWSEKRLNFLAMETKNAFVDGPFGSDLKNDDYQDEGIPLIQLNNIRDGKHILRNMKFISQKKKDSLIRHLALPNDVVIAKMAEPVARAAIVSDEFCEYIIVADCVKLTPNLNLIDLNFLIWAINSDCVRENAELVSTGTTRIRINLGELKKLKVPYPSLNEQQKISNFLDHETAKIDNLIEKQQQLIELLKEKRQAVISHAVTKGLDPNAPMKDSGVEWLGEVPEHWEIIKFDYVINSVGDIDHYMPNSVDSGIPYVMTGDLQDLVSKIDFESCKQVAYSDYIKLSRKIKTSKDDIILARYATIGTISYVDIDAEFLVSYSCVTIKPNIKRTSGRYLFCYLKSQAFLQAIKMHINSNTQGNVGVDSLRNVKIVVPPLSEQNEIIHFLNEEIVKVDKLINKAESAISLMQERRTALISAAVTGKIDVRNWQAPTIAEADTELSA